MNVAAGLREQILRQHTPPQRLPEIICYPMTGHQRPIPTGSIRLILEGIGTLLRTHAEKMGKVNSAGRPIRDALGIYAS